MLGWATAAMTMEAEEEASMPAMVRAAKPAGTTQVITM